MEMVTIDSKTFIEELERHIQYSKDAFIKNMGGVEDKTFCEWVDTFSRWMEWQDEEMCEKYYNWGPKR